MVIRANEKQCELREHMREGSGSVGVEKFTTEQGLPTHYRLFAELVLKPGCSIGAHPHNGESEIFYVLNGNAEYLDDGSVVTLCPGDVAVCGDGQTHSIANREQAEVRVLAVIVTNA